MSRTSIYRFIQDVRKRVSGEINVGWLAGNSLDRKEDWVTVYTHIRCTLIFDGTTRTEANVALFGTQLLASTPALGERRSRAQFL